VLRASEQDVGRLSVALIEAGIGILALVPRTATLEELFFELTEGAPAAAPEFPIVEERMVSASGPRKLGPSDDVT
jgi:hypothetical protein